MAPSGSKKGKGRDDNNDDKRKRNESSRSKEASEHDAALAKARAEKKKAVDDRRQQRAEDDQEALLVEQDDETEREAMLRVTATSMQEENDNLHAEITQMRALLRQHRQQQDAAAQASAMSSSATTGSGPSMASCATAGSGPALASAFASAFATQPDPPTIDLPSSRRQTTIELVRRYMGLEGEASDARWLEVRAAVRDGSALGGLNYTRPWTRQDKTRLGTLYAVLRERIPELRRFTNNWAAEFLVQDAFNHRRGNLLSKQKRTRLAASGAPIAALPPPVQPAGIEAPVGSSPPSQSNDVAPNALSLIPAAGSPSEAEASPIRRDMPSIPENPLTDDPVNEAGPSNGRGRGRRGRGRGRGGRGGRGAGTRGRGRGAITTRSQASAIVHSGDTRGDAAAISDSSGQSSSGSAPSTSDADDDSDDGN